MADLQHSLVLAAPYIDRYGYTGVFGGILLESFGVPMPGEALLIASAVLATKDTLHLVPLLAWAWVAAVLGDNIGYGIGRFGGRRLILRYGQPIGITETRLAKIEAFSHRWGGEVVLVARFFAGLRQLNGLVAGTAGMRWWRFLAYNSAGAALWVSAWGVGVYVFGQHIGQLMPWVHRVGYVLLIAGAAVLLLVLLGSCLHHGWAKCTTGKDHTHQERTAHRAHRRVPPGASGAYPARGGSTDRGRSLCCG